MAPIVPELDLDTSVPRGFPNFDPINYLKIPAMTLTTRLLPSKTKGTKSCLISTVRGGGRGDNTWDAGRGIQFRLETYDITQLAIKEPPVSLTRL